MDLFDWIIVGVIVLGVAWVAWGRLPQTWRGSGAKNGGGGGGFWWGGGNGGGGNGGGGGAA